MEAKWLEDFLSVARTGNFSQSAAERHITQSAFSRRIKALEQWVGVALIDRSSYPTRLTSAGEKFHDVVTEVTSSLLKTRQDLRQVLNADRKLLRIAVQHSLAGGFLARWLATLPLQRDATLVRVKADNLHDCIRELEDGNVDVLICYTHADLPLGLDKERYPSFLMTDDTLVAFTKPAADGQPLHSLRPETARQVPWLAYSAEAFLGRAAALAHGKGPLPVTLHAVFQSALAEALRAAAVAGLGVAWLPVSLVKDDVAHGSLVRAGDSDFDLPLQVRLYGDRLSLTGHLRTLLASVCNIAGMS
jgi:DNA-binding transcriptional LysR family regulator